MRRLLVLDFDGTMTDAEVEGAPFREGYLEDLAALTGWTSARVHEAAARYEAEVRTSNEHGWIHEGHVVAPASVDPYLRIMPVARMILDEAGVLRDERDRQRLLEGVLFKYNYRKTTIAFRPSAGPLLRALGTRRDIETFVVTNSDTELVRNKIQRLDAEHGGVSWLIPRVHGHARKFVIDDGFEKVPVSIALQGLGRPVLLRRRHYHDVLDMLRAGVGVGWEEIAVVGDIFELDLALPLALGARVALAASRHAPEHERRFLETQPRGVVLNSLEEVLPWLERG